MKDLTQNIFILIAFCIIGNCKSISDLRKNENSLLDDNFLIISHLSDNEMETRMKWKDIMGLETKLDLDPSQYSNR